MSDPPTRDPSLRAADPERSAWVAANAGAGKTHTLANRVTRLLFAKARPERILCLTYTKAAAAEMQDRLFKQLGKWSMMPDAELAAHIVEIGAEVKGAEALREARRLFAQALETPGGLKIQTIHAFCQNLLTRFPIEAGVPPSFRVLDDRTARDLLAEARARVLERAGSGDAALAAAVAHLVTQTSEGRMQQLLDAALGNDRRKLDRFFASQDPLTERLRVAHGAGAQDSPRAVAERFAALMQAMPLTEIAAWLATGSKTDIERGQDLIAALAADDAAARFDLLRGILLTQEGARRARLATAGLGKARPDLMSAFDTFCNEFLSAEQCHRAAHAASLAEAMLVVTDAVRDVYASMKRARGVLDYDDLIAETLKLLDRGDAAQWVLFKLDGGLDHILIDEAQDTSPEQWAIVRKLTEEFFAGAGRHDGMRTVFAVGDEKQSIFSFQGAEPRQFDVNRVYFKERVEAADLAFSDERLQTSRRSAPEVLRFVDEVFSTPEASAGLTSQNEPIRHTPLRETAKGRVEVWPPIKPSDAPEPDVWRPVDVESRTSPVVRLAIKIADKIKRWTDGGTRLPGRDEAIAPGDIMILLPRREPFGSEVIRRLKERGIAVAGADRIRLTEQIAVMDLIALGRFVLLPEDDLNLAALLRSPMIGMSEDELFDLAHRREGLLWGALARRGGGAHDFLAEMRARADYAPPFEFFAHALTVRGMRAKLLARLGQEANDAIDEFLSHALAHESQNTPSLEGFLHWVERGGAEIKRDMERGRNEVRVMTVHGAKGLEAEIVILADTTTLPEPPGKKGHLLYTADRALFPVADNAAPEAVLRAKSDAAEETLKEHRRLLYVALTRAKDRLYVAGFENKRGVKDGSWYALCARAAEAIGTAIERDGETVHVLGELTDDAAEPRLPFEAPPLALRPWLDRSAPLERPDPRLIHPSEASGEDEPALPLALTARHAVRFRRGQLVHMLLARLPDLPEAKRKTAALRYLKARGADDPEALAEETIRVLNDPRFAPAFAPGSRAEVGLTAKLPELGPTARVNGRIDRLAITENEVLIVDFKTNRPPPESEAALARLYKTQMALYRAAAAKVFLGKRIACALVWTEGPSLMPLSDALLDAEMSRIAAHIDFMAPRS